MMSRVVKYLVGLGFCLALGGSCGGTSTKTEGSESHFLDACMQGSCGDGLSCICGVCTRTCSASECSALSPGAQCVELADVPNTEGCTDVSASQPVCDQPCVMDADCTTLGTSFGCREGVCRSTMPPAPPPEGGPVPDRCSLPLDPGLCLAIVPSFGYLDGACVPFTYGGCEGNDNRFATRQECEETCGIAASDVFACEVSSDCMITSPGCCGPCEPLGINDIIAIRLDRGPDYHAATCPPPEPTCGACPEVTDEQQLRANYAARCVAGRCEAFDVRTSDYADCSDGAGCKLISRFDCCSQVCGGPVAAIREDVDPVVELACSEATVDFDCTDADCPFPLPPNVSAACNGTRCEVVWEAVLEEASCRVGDTIYPSGSQDIPDPFSCNTCACGDGQLGCTLIGCDIPCPAGTVPGVSCDQCGPVDNCEIVFHGCLAECDGNDDCGGMTPFCMDGLCRTLCG